MCIIGYLLFCGPAALIDFWPAIMGQRLLKKTQPAEAASGDSVIGIGPDESVLILIKHCSDMKQQEMRLRLITLFLLLSCMALILFTGRVDLRQQENSTSVGRGVSSITFLFTAFFCGCACFFSGNKLNELIA